MQKYRGYYIDGVVFSTRKEIDEFVKNSVLERYRQFCKMFCSDHYTAQEKMQISVEMSEREKCLHYEFGMSLEELENIFNEICEKSLTD